MLSRKPEVGDFIYMNTRNTNPYIVLVLSVKAELTVVYDFEDKSIMNRADETLMALGSLLVSTRLR